MRARLTVFAGRAVGVALIVLVLYLVGWQDRVTDTSGREHVGRIELVDETVARIRVDDVVQTVPIENAGAVRYGLGGAFATLGKNAGLAVAGLAIHALALLVIALRWGILLHGANLSLPLRSVIRLSWIGHFLGQVVPGGVVGGDVIKSLYVAHEHPEATRTRALVVAFADRLIPLLVLCAIACVALLVGPEGLPVDEARVVVIVLLVCGVLGGVIFYSATLQRVLRLHHLTRRLPFPGAVAEVRHAMHLYRGRPGHVALVAVISFVGHTLVLTAFWFYGRALGAPMGAATMLVGIPLAQLLAAVPGLPGGWGVGDFAFLFFLPATGVPGGLAVALSFTYRIAQTLLGLPGGLMLARRI
ncbi:MAG: lysylphosphatidylglycerol synthase transmembrane domain-containing protein [Planctomycetota bacterium]